MSLSEPRDSTADGHPRFHVAAAASGPVPGSGRRRWHLSRVRKCFAEWGERRRLGSLWHDGRMLGAMLSVAHGDALWGWIAELDYTLLLTGIRCLQEIGVGVAAGVLIAAFLGAGVLIPSITAALWRCAWWPGRRAQQHAEQLPASARP